MCKAMALLLLLIPSGGLAALSPLEKAYQQEIELLTSEKQALAARIAAAEQAARAQAEELRAQVSKLSEELTVLRIENDDLDERMALARGSRADGADRRALLQSVLKQAHTTLTQHGVVVGALASTADGDPAAPRQATAPPTVDDANVMSATQVTDVFTAATTLVQRLGGLRVEEGPYFAVDGKERQGKILRLAQVAAIALDNEYGGTLVPAAAGALRVVDTEAKSSAAALLAGEDPPTVGVVLFDPLERGRTDVRGDRSLWQTFLAGGYVMWPILALAILGLLILSERFLVLRRVHSNTDRLVHEVGQSISRGSWDEATDSCGKRRGAVSRVLETIIRNRRLNREQLEALVTEAILAERPTLERFLPAMNVIAVVAPLLGLLGTVTGMITTFMVITEHGTGDPRLLSGGISEALLTTEFGLIVAIPALLAHALLSGRVDHILGAMETQAIKLLNSLCCQPGGQETRASKLDDGDLQGKPSEAGHEGIRPLLCRSGVESEIKAEGLAHSVTSEVGGA